MKDRTMSPGHNNEQVSTALLLAAGTGSRLAPLTDRVPKCLVEVNEISILERLINSLQEHNFKRLVIVVGHQADCIRNFLGTRAGGMDIEYVTSPLYKTTNNIYSLWLARKVIDEPFLLIESDVVFDSEMLTDMLQPDRMAVAKLRPWMDGTTVTVNKNQEIDAFYDGAHKRTAGHYKTVNIYSLSALTWELVRERLDRHISANMRNGYYETVFADLVKEGFLSFAPVFFDSNRWYEIDNMKDLHAAEQMCGHYRRPAAIAIDKVAMNSKSHALPAFKGINTLDYPKRGVLLHPEKKVSAPTRTTSPLPQ